MRQELFELRVRGTPEVLCEPSDAPDVLPADGSNCHACLARRASVRLGDVASSEQTRVHDRL
jgi:hypothetical protein